MLCNNAPATIVRLLVIATVVARTLGRVASEFKEKHNNIELLQNPNMPCTKANTQIGNDGKNKIMLMVVNAPTKPKPIKKVR